MAVAEGLRAIAARGQATGGPALDRDRIVPVLPALAPLLPFGGLRRGGTVSVVGGPGSTALTLALAASATATGGWAAAVGCPRVGVLAAAELGVALERFPIVAAPPDEEWATVVAALLDALDVVLAWPPSRGGARPGDVRRLVARARERGSVLVVHGSPVEGPELRLSVAAARWHGLGAGHGHLAGREVEVVATGRGAAVRARRATLLLPSSDGGVRVLGAHRDGAHRDGARRRARLGAAAGGRRVTGVAT